MKYTRDELIQKARQWMISEYGSPIGKSEEERAHYHERLGFLVHFIMEAFTEEDAR